MKVWITKYALTDGIFEAEVQDRGDGMVSRSDQGPYQFFHGEGREWHRTRDAAIARAEDMRRRKIASLEKQLAKLRAKVFA